MLFLIALQFLTRITLRKNFNVTSSLLSQSMIFFPIVGLLIGGIQALVFFGIHILKQGQNLSPSITALLLLLIPIIITGAFHIEGFSDMVDGFLSGENEKEKIVHIMKDPHIGVIGMVSVICLILAKFIFLKEIVENLNILSVIEILLLVSCLSRWAMVISAGISKYAITEPGLGEPFTKGVGWRIVCISSVVPVIGAIICFHLWSLIWIGIPVLTAFIVSHLVTRKIGGITGDIFGGINEITEIVLLLNATLSMVSGVFS